MNFCKTLVKDKASQNCFIDIYILFALIYYYKHLLDVEGR